jgi:stress response protein YsnF
MRNVVVGVFESGIKAQEAVLALRNNGFNSDNIDISENDERNVETDRSSEHESGIKRFFKNLLGETDEADNYSRLARKGTMVTVYTDSRGEAELASDILDQNGAINANERGLLETDKDVSRGESGERVRTRKENLKKEEIDSDEERIRRTSEPSKEFSSSLPIVEENLNVSKKVEETERVSLRSRIIEKPVEELLKLRKEHINIQRVPVNRPATEADLKTFKEGTIEASEIEEVPVVKKEARVVEEVKIKKEIGEKGETIRGSVRKQDVDIERKRKDKEKNPDV